MKRFLSFLRNDEGQTFAEYALILVLVGIALLTILGSFSTQLIAAFQQVIDAL